MIPGKWIKEKGETILGKKRLKFFQNSRKPKNLRFRKHSQSLVGLTKAESTFRHTIETKNKEKICKATRRGIFPLKEQQLDVWRMS